MRRSWPIIALLLTAALPAAAAPPVQLGLEQAAERAERLAPELGPARAAVTGARRARRAASAVLSAPPRIELAAGPRWHSDPRETGIDVSVGAWQDLSLGGLVGARRSFARSLDGEARARLELTRQDARTRAALAWIDARLARELVRVRQQSLEHAREIARIARARVDAGSVAPAEETLAQVAVGNARAQLLDAGGRKLVAETRLRQLTGIAARSPIELVGPLDAPERPGIRACRSPDLALAEARTRSSRASAEATRALGRPVLSLGPSLTREATGDLILLARAAFPLPFTNPAALDAARADAEADVARAETSALRRNLQRESELAREEGQHARELRQALAEGVVSPAREALRQTLAQFAAGKIDTSVVLAARRELLAAEERWAEAAADARRADLTLARLLGCAGGTR
jgi:outer membrane protein TolC